MRSVRLTISYVFFQACHLLQIQYHDWMHRFSGIHHDGNRQRNKKGRKKRKGHENVWRKHVGKLHNFFRHFPGLSWSEEGLWNSSFHDNAVFQIQRIEISEIRTEKGPTSQENEYDSVIGSNVTVFYK